MLKFLALTSMLAVVSAFDYCTINSQNTLCKYKATTIGTACMAVYPMNVTATDKTTILNVHNQLRRKVAKGLETRGNPGPQPSATNMRQLVWDDELAMMAQTHAQQCVFQHDANRDVSRYPVGQNLAIQMSTAQWTKSDWTSMINSWYNEVTGMNSAYVNSFPSNPTSVIGHYTQAVWATSTSVGCGVMNYKDTSFYGTNPYKILYVCNYGPAGNYLGSKVYITGTAASACPTGTVASDGLCV